MSKYELRETWKENRKPKIRRKAKVTVLSRAFRGNFEMFTCDHVREASTAHLWISSGETLMSILSLELCLTDQAEGG